MSTLKVENIQHTNGTNAIAIRSDGIITKNIIPMLKVGLSSAATISAGSGKVPFDSFNNSLVFDPEDNMSAFNTSTYTFTCPVAGKYFVYAKTTVLSSNTAREHQTYVYKNGSAILTNQLVFIGGTPIINDGSNFSGAQTSGIVNLAVNDTLQLYGKMNTTSGATFTFSSGIVHTTLGAYRIGA